MRPPSLCTLPPPVCCSWSPTSLIAGSLKMGVRNHIYSVRNRETQQCLQKNGKCPGPQFKGVQKPTHPSLHFSRDRQDNSRSVNIPPCCSSSHSTDGMCSTISAADRAARPFIRPPPHPLHSWQHVLSATGRTCPSASPELQNATPLTAILHPFTVGISGLTRGRQLRPESPWQTPLL